MGVYHTVHIIVTNLQFLIGGVPGHLCNIPSFLHNFQYIYGLYAVFWLLRASVACVIAHKMPSSGGF